ncbi:MAG: hypothetical protein JSW28_01655 [Thermoplasmata archaeon]|nr:MAG: hypothetical protein JSW28_01655 [Thermoplasmata archaeon]
MRKRIFLIFSILLTIVLVFSGCTWFSEESEFAHGFDDSNLKTPGIPPYPPHKLIIRPQENSSQLPPGFKYNLTWAVTDVYSEWGGFIGITCENTGQNDIFVYRYGIAVNWSEPAEWIYEEENVLVPKGEERDLGIVYFDAPNTTGNFSYNIILSLLVKDNKLYEEHNIESWFDNGTVHSRKKTVTVLPLEEFQEAEIIHNHNHYFEKVKEKVDFDAAGILSLVSDVKERYPGDYNIYQGLAIYDFVLKNLSYIPDSKEEDYWCVPGETLTRGGGDCEDISILFSSSIGALGGTTRIYLTQSHVFSVLYIGNETAKNGILDAIERYYKTEPNFVLFSDEKGYWIAADPAGSWYLGGLPADASPAHMPSGYGYNFENTTDIHVVDVVG